MRIKRIFAGFLSAAMLFASVSVLAAKTDDDEKEIQEIQQSGEFIAFNQIAEFIAENYIDDFYTSDKVIEKGLSKLLENDEELLISLLKATLSSMDDYSEFFTPEEYEAFKNQLSHTFYGIGVTMQMGEDGYVEITGFAEENGNAEKAGFRIGDKFCKVNGEDVTGLSLEAVRAKVIGEEGTKVKITVLRDNREIELTATRVAVNANTVLSGILSGNIGYIQILSFGVNTANEFAEQLDVMRKQNVKNIILDMRNNGGGLVPAAAEIAKTIVPKGKIIDVKYRRPQYDMTYTSNLTKKEFDFIVLVNEHTASASEILASAIQDSGAGKLVGTTTFGKAVIQNTYQLENKAVLKLTAGQYITRNGKEINHVGLTPDEYVENETAGLDMSEYSEFDFRTRAALGSGGENVKAAKERLYILGYYNGDTENSVFDAELKEAVSDFQRAHDILSYGVLDIITQARIDSEVSKIETTTDNQLIKAYEMFGGKKENLFEKK